MDITKRYRTKYPPKEHEEAVRMLLEGIGKQNASSNNFKKTADINYEYDRRSMTSVDSKSSVNLRNLNNNLGSMRSKATSTSDCSRSCSESSNSATYREPIPSRTIAVQCDLKTSSLKRDFVFDGSMQASSISSTRYGFYNYSPETLDKRRKLQRSVSSRDVNEDAARNRGQTLIGSQIEAPTSMSELSSCLGTSDEEKSFHEQRKISATSYNSDLDPTSRVELKRRFPLSSMSSAHSMNRDSPLDGKSIARARINSLPRRPVTALSYVSTTKLRDQNSPENSDDESVQAQPMKNRAMSQQTLTRPRTPKPEPVSSASSSSESESIDRAIRKPLRNHPKDSNFQSDRNEEMIILQRASQSIPIKPPRPTLISSSHNEQVRDYKISNIPTIQAQQIQRRQLSDDKSYKVLSSHQDSDEELQNRERQELNENRRQHSRANQAIYNRENAENFTSSSPRHNRIDQLASSIKVDGSYLGGTTIIKGSRRFGSSMNNEINSMSLSRRQKPVPQQQTPNRYSESNGSEAGSYYHDNLSRMSQTYSQTLLPKSTLHTSGEETRDFVGSSKKLGSNVGRSTSMRHISRFGDSIARHKYSPVLNHHIGANLYRENIKQDKLDCNEFEDSESPSTRTWANPNPATTQKINDDKQLRNRNSSRSFSTRDIRNMSNLVDTSSSRPVYRDSYKSQKNDYSPYDSSSESSALNNTTRFINSHELNFDSQHRLNESGLPEIDPAKPPRRVEAPSSYIGLSHKDYMSPQLNTGRFNQIRGRAMSQQSLTRPTMPSTGGRRRGGSNPGSDVGGSSMSLVSRLNGRYENAHTRTPVVMYIPQATPRANSLSDGPIGKASTLRKSSRSRQKSNPSLKAKRSLSRNGSDSESSSMLRTLISPKSRQGHNTSKRSSRMLNLTYGDEDDEDMDGVGQLATEVDSYKFRRRYSIPKDAKINWFAKLKQRVSSSGR